MKILVIGSDGFVGKYVAKALADDHDIYCANRKPAKDQIFIDLLEKKSIADALSTSLPEIVINCAGVVDNSDAAKNNVLFTSNLMELIINLNLPVKRVIISGSAAEYGLVDQSNIPVLETAPLNANSAYGLSKLEEERIALSLGEQGRINVVVARIFNPIGPGMHSKFIIPRIIAQINEFKAGLRKTIEVSRLDSKRDYIDINDIGGAIKCLVEQSPKETVYNIGSGISTSNGELIHLILKYSRLTESPEIVESSSIPEPLVAEQADITRIVNEFGWHPVGSVENTIKEIVYGTK